MACTQRTNIILQQKSKKKIETAASPLEKLTHICLARGANGIVGIGRQFRIIDDDGDKKLSFKEFYKGCNDFGANLTKEEITEIFQSIDKDGSGSIDFEEFLKALRPPMNKARMDIVNRAFVKLDKTKDGVIKVDDLKGVYNCKKHPKYLNGEKTEDEIFIEFLRTFQPDDSADDTVTKEEFFSYYSGLSASIDNDAYFDLMIRHAFKL
ncbi:Calcyphosine [Paragonimus heterotremus]|uniref:Calcyphosine n=1 Tax=Paragonimus heterotremus TaxID=100268 RepID=A0A8J4SY58_9TREM|nr:Calcyphosine [Paragonimus heterotremus]